MGKLTLEEIERRAELAGLTSARCEANTVFLREAVIVRDRGGEVIWTRGKDGIMSRHDVESWADERIADAIEHDPETLRECPFCGGDATYTAQPLMKYEAVMHRAECPQCGIGTYVKQSESEARAAWNRRA